MPSSHDYIKDKRNNKIKIFVINKFTFYTHVQSAMFLLPLLFLIYFYNLFQQRVAETIYANIIVIVICIISEISYILSCFGYYILNETLNCVLLCLLSVRIDFQTIKNIKNCVRFCSHSYNTEI